MFKVRDLPDVCRCDDRPDVVKMSVDDWIRVPTHPYQRDTEERAGRAKYRHLKEYKRRHKFVDAAVVDGAVVHKISGHTRGLLWGTGELGRPEDNMLVVALHYPEDMEELKEEYDSTDSRAACKTPKDEVQSVYRSEGLAVRSNLLVKGSMLSHLKYAAGMEHGSRKSLRSTSVMVVKWKRWIMEVDAMGLSRSRCNKFLALLLLLTRKYGAEKPQAFFRAYDNMKGSCDSDSGYDGVMGLSHLLNKADAGWKNLSGYTELGWRCYHWWDAGERVPRPILSRRKDAPWRDLIDEFRAEDAIREVVTRMDKPTTTKKNGHASSRVIAAMFDPCGDQ